MKLTGSGVILTNERIVAFFKQNTSPSIHQAFENNALSFITMVEGVLERQLTESSKDREHQALQQLLSTFEENQKLWMDSMMDSLHQRVRNTTEGVIDKVDARVSHLAKQVDLTVSQAVSRIDLKLLTESISDAVKSWLEATTKEAGLDIKLSLNNFQTQLTEHLRSTVTGPLDSIKSQVMEHIPSVVDNRMRDGLMILEKDIGEVKAGFLNGHLDTLLHKALEKVSQNRGDIQALQSSLPHMVKNVVKNELCKVEQQVSDITSIVDNKLLERLSHVGREVSDAAISTRKARTDTENLIAKVEHLEKQVIVQNTRVAHASSKTRGVVGESIVYDQLSEKLHDRDGYSIEPVGGTAHACDFLIKRQGYPDVRIDSKSYESKEKVRSKEVKKFQSDLIHNGCHGIMLSLHSGVVGKGPFIDIEQLSNHKLAIYLSNTGTNCVDVVLDALSIIYRLDPLVSKQDEGDIRLSPECIERIRTTISEFGEKAIAVRNKLRDSISLLNDMLDTIREQLLKALPIPNGSHHTASPVQEGGAAPCVCDKCGYCAKNMTGLAAHKRHCKKMAESQS